MNIAALLLKSGRSFAPEPAVTVGDTPWIDYGALAYRVAVMAGNLHSRHDLRPGERVALAMANCPEYLETLFSIWHAGLVAVPINAKLHLNEFRYILENSETRLCFATPALAESLSSLVGEVPNLARVVSTDSSGYAVLRDGRPVAMSDARPDDSAWLFYTSGTTGQPKGANLTHRNLLVMTLSYFADIDSVSHLDTVLHTGPMSHASGLYSLPFIAKGAGNVLPPGGTFDPVEIVDLLAVHRNVTLFAAPTMLTRLIYSDAAERGDFTNLKTLYYGGGPAYLADQQRALGLFGPKLVQIYGQGESPMTISALSKLDHANTDHPRYLDRLTSTGIARTDVEIMVADEADRPVAAGQVGEVLVRGDVVMPGYWRNPEATAKTLRGGWLHTGDLGFMDEDGYLTLKDRSKDMIISGGTNIYPREIEEVLVRHPAVLEVSVIGRPHREWGEEVVAFIVAHPEERVTSEELNALCLDNLARFKRPRAYFMIDSLPKNNYGKVLKTELRNTLSRETSEVS